MTDVMTELRGRFLVRCADHLERIAALRDGDTLAAEEMQALVHSLAGAAGTFGFPGISAAAGACDAAFARGGAPDGAMIERLVMTIDEALATRKD